MSHPIEPDAETTADVFRALLEAIETMSDWTQDDRKQWDDRWQKARRMVYLVVCDDGNSQEAEIDIDSIWTTDAEAQRRKAQITDARRVWVEGRNLGEIGIVYG